MDIIMSQSLCSHIKLPPAGCCSSSSSSASLLLLPPLALHFKAGLVTCSPSCGRSRRSCTRHAANIRLQPRRWRGLGAACAASGTESTASTDGGVQERWLFEPVGDGDSRHIGYEVKMPDAFEIVSNVVTVGRLPEKADMVIPVATVSAIHARIQKKGGDLLITDLDSTNGTFIDDRRLRPGAIVAVPPGSCITFGDVHLAMFRVSKLGAGAESTAEDSETKADTTSRPESDETS